jgi:uncharacterized protein YacL
MSIELTLRFVGGVLAGIGAWDLAQALLPAQLYSAPGTVLLALFAIVSASFGIAFLITPYVTTRPFHGLLESLSHAPATDLLVGTLGLLAGLVIGALLAPPLSMMPRPFGELLPISLSLAVGYLGMATALVHKRELLGLFGLPWEFGRGRSGVGEQRVVVDTNAIIDGRLADLTKTGFVTGPLVVPQFVLAELHRIADSPDPVRRTKGRRGLEILTRLQKDSSVELEVIEADADGIAEVDAQLVTMARTLHCPIVTNDYNLNRVAGLQGVKVLNINELANAVKPVVLPGEEMMVKVIQEGKEFGQGVGYLDDGTMVVVENGRHLLHSTANVVVNRVLQTVAGRMIFAQPKASFSNNRP